jgi:sugar phosphate permease
MLHFLRENLRWLGAGFLLTFSSAFGQTWFISLFAGFIKDEYGLTDGEWGSLYTVATLSAAGLMFWRGSWADSIRLVRLAPAMTLLFASAALGMAFSQSIWVLGVALFLLRYCGQGMFSHIAMTAMGRWFEARRGQAVSITNLGHPAGEVVVPLAAVFFIGAIGWHATWAAVAGVLVFIIAPLLLYLLSETRAPRGASRAFELPGLAGRHWGRRDAARHWLLPALLPIILTPGFVSTVVFFHQVHVAEVKGWALANMAPGYSAFAVSTVASALAAGWAADRFGPHWLLPGLLVPMAIGVAIIGPAAQVETWYLALGFIGLTQGTASALWGVILPVVYGTRHLGSVRSLVTTVMVVSTAIGPGVTGVLIDLGVTFPVQSLFMGAWCIGLSAFCYLVQRRLARELRPAPVERT